MKTYEVRVGNCEPRYLGGAQPNAVVLTLCAENEEDAEAQAYAYMHSINWGEAKTDWVVSKVEVKGEPA